MTALEIILMVLIAYISKTVVLKLRFNRGHIQNVKIYRDSFDVSRPDIFLEYLCLAARPQMMGIVTGKFPDFDASYTDYYFFIFYL